MDNVALSPLLHVSRIIHGQMRLTAWGLRGQDLLSFIREVMEAGVTTFDHADIYGHGECEALFGEALALQPGLRDGMQLITKCGIQLISEHFPGRKVKHYDYSYNHIVKSVEGSLKRLRTDRIDLLLLHRPAPFFEPAEVARAFSHLCRHGKVLHFGVSNFNPMQFSMLSEYVDEALITNQVEVSSWCLEHFENGNMDFFLQERIRPMAWSPLAGGRLLQPTDEKGHRLHAALSVVAQETGHPDLAQVALAWLMSHPAGILPVIGTGKLPSIHAACAAEEIRLSPEQWYRIYTASTGTQVP